MRSGASESRAPTKVRLSCAETAVKSSPALRSSRSTKAASEASSSRIRILKPSIHRKSRPSDGGDVRHATGGTFNINQYIPSSATTLANSSNLIGLVTKLLMPSS